MKQADSMIADPKPPNTWVSVRDHENPVSPGQKRPPRGTLATPVPEPRQPEGEATGYSAAGPEWHWGLAASAGAPSGLGGAGPRPRAGGPPGGAARTP